MLRMEVQKVFYSDLDDSEIFSIGFFIKNCQIKGHFITFLNVIIVQQRIKERSFPLSNRNIGLVATSATQH